MLAAELIREVSDLDPWLERWDALAVESAEPYGAPAWMLAWWRHVAKGERELRVVVVHEGDMLVGLSPTFVQIGNLGLAEYRTLGAGSSHRIGPLAKPGREREVAELVARTLNGASPRPSSVVLEGADAESPWPTLLRDAWPGMMRPRRHLALTLPAPVVTLAEDFDTWMKGRRSHFRQDVRRQRRRLEEAGVRISMPTAPEEMKRAVQALVRLHQMRWDQKGDESNLTPGSEAMLLEVAETLGPSRLRLWMMEVEGEYICAQLHIAAGGVIGDWNGGFDPAWGNRTVALVTLVAAIEDACGRGDRMIDMGGGGQSYKWRVADRDAPLVWTSIFPRNRRYPLTRAQLLPKETRLLARNAVRRMPEPVRSGLRRLRGRPAT